MAGLAPRLRPTLRFMPLAIVAGVHAAAVAGLLLVPAVRDRLVAQTPMMVELREAPRDRAPEPAPIRRPVFHNPAPAAVPMPTIALTPEAAIAPPPERGPALAAPSPTPSPTIAAPSAVEPPRYDIAYLRNPAPEYPSLSRRMKEQGRVMLRVLVGEGGEARDIEVRTSSGSERLDRAAVEAVRRWRFAPAHRGTDTIAAWVLVPIVFQLEA